MKNPWIAIDLFTNEVLGRYPTDAAAYMAHFNQSVIVQYSPRKCDK